MTISTKKMEKAVTKFLTYGRGIMGNFQTRRFVTNTKQAGEYTYNDLINPSLYNLSNLKSLMRSLNKMMRSHVDDPEIFPQTPIYFKHETPTGDVISFTVKDAYCMVRAAYLEQSNNKTIIDTRKELAEVNKELNTLKTRSERKAELNAKRERLEGVLN